MSASIENKINSKKTKKHKKQMKVETKVGYLWIKKINKAGCFVISHKKI